MDLLWILLAQVGGQTPDFSSTPPPAKDMASWWPLATTIMSLVVAAIAALFTAWQKLRERKLENTASSEQSRLQLEIAELTHQFESRKQLHEQLSEQITNLLNEGRALREELKSARTEVATKEQLISELRTEVGSLQSQIKLCRKEIAGYQEALDKAKNEAAASVDSTGDGSADAASAKSTEPTNDES